jgi:threonine dehydratase
MTIDKLALERAYARTDPWRRKTSLLKNTFLNDLWDAEVFLKCEQEQVIGAFKIRGAANFILRLSAEKRRRGLVTHSSGNHAQAIAYLACQFNVPAHIVMPENSSPVKISNAKKWGAEIILCGPTIESRLSVAESVLKEQGGTMIPPFDHEWIMEGQATCAMEIIGEIDDIDMVIAPLGGGGLLSGSALAAKHFSPTTAVIGAEPQNASDGYEGLKSGNRVESHSVNTIADGLRTTVGVAPFGVIKERVDDIWLADENEILPWQKRIMRELKVVIEPSSAVPFAAMEKHKEEIKGKRVAVIVSGGNVDL